MDYYEWSKLTLSDGLVAVIDGKFYFEGSSYIEPELQKARAQAILAGWQQQLKTYPAVRDNVPVVPLYKDGSGYLDYTENELEILAKKGLAELDAFFMFCRSAKKPVEAK